MIKNLNIEEIRELELIFSALSNLFSFPSKEILSTYVFCSSNINAFNHLSNDTGLLFSKLNQHFSDIADVKLMIEYSRLFVGPFVLIAPPYGSYYLDNGRLMGDSTIALMKLYDEAGLSIKSSFKELPDHIIAELEFLYFLFFNKHKLIEGDNSGQIMTIDSIISDFYQSFFMSWIPAFSRLIIEHTTNEFYKLSGELLNLVSSEANKKLFAKFEYN